MEIDDYVAKRLLVNEANPSTELYDLMRLLSRATREGRMMVKGSIKVDIPGVVQEEGCLYLERTYRLLKVVKERVDQLMQPLAAPPIVKDLPLTDEQRAVIERALSSSLSFISGGPGTGKTYTAGWLVRLLAGDNYRVSLAAPTGKAAQRLLNSIEKVFGDKKLPNIKAVTLHALLGRDAHPLHDDLILVDESSMIDLPMMARLLTKVGPATRLILMGDPDQLPPVEEGSIFADLAHLGGKLTRSLRMNHQELQNAAEAIRQGIMPNFDDHIVTFTEIDNPFDAQKLVVKEAIKLFPTSFTTPKESFEALERFRLLSPKKGGPLGVDAINSALLQELSQKDALLPLPIMITKNDYNQGLFNGECGILVAPSSECQRVHQNGYPLIALKNGYALFPTTEGLKRFELSHLPPFSLAFCLSIHKSQGSEFTHVRLLLPDAKENLSRQLLYTGLTRAKERADIWSTKETINSFQTRD